MIAPHLGTVAWAELTGGNLRRSDRRHQILSTPGHKIKTYGPSPFTASPKSALCIQVIRHQLFCP